MFQQVLRKHIDSIKLYSAALAVLEDLILANTEVAERQLILEKVVLCVSKKIIEKNSTFRNQFSQFMNIKEEEKLSTVLAHNLLILYCILKDSLLNYNVDNDIILDGTLKFINDNLFKINTYIIENKII